MKNEPQSFESRSAPRHVKSERGSALVEFAVVLTVFLTLLFAIMGFSQAVSAYHFVSNAAREATRYASVRGTTFASNCSVTPPYSVQYNCKANDPGGADVALYVNSIVPSGMSVSGAAAASCANPGVGQLNVCVSWPGTAPAGAAGACPSNPSGGNNPGCLVKVQVQYTYGFTLPFVSKDVSSITMSSTSETVIQQ
jgi:Flp pilus assembly protein TadG